MVKEVLELVSTEWLEKNLRSKDLRVLDASWYLPTENRNPKREFSSRHIAGSKFFDINSFSDPDDLLPHMVPPQHRFCSELSKLDVGAGNHVVFYDGSGLFSAARAWWLIKLFGFTKVSILDGGLPKWVAENRPLSNVVSGSNPRSNFITPRFNNQLVCDWKQVKLCVRDKIGQIIDARPFDRFSGQATEPRPGLRSGHIPGSLNICYKELLNDDRTLKNKELLSDIFAAKGVDLTLPIITSCGSGVTAAILFLALEVIGAKNLAIYDGSWSEWGSRDDLDIEISL